MSRVGSHPYLRHPEWHADDAARPIAFAHRGGTSSAPENTVAAFDHAWSLGYRYLETDVHRSRDGVLVAFHDSNLARTCGVDADIAALSVDELSEIRVDGEHAIPLMTDLLERFPLAHFNIDAKAESAVEGLCDLVTSTGSVDRVCLASFSQRRIDRMRSIVGPTLMTNLGTAGIVQLRILQRTRNRGHQAAQIPPSSGRLPVADRPFVRAAHRGDMPVHVWTINDRAEVERLLDIGVDGIMTDDTVMLKELFTARDLWPPLD